MSSVLDKQVVLSLNSAWQPIGWRTVRQAIISLSGGDSEHPAMALDMLLDKDGALVYVNPVNWEEWMKLPVRDGDLAITTKTGAIRAPVAIISRNYAKMPVKSPKLSKRAIFERDGGVCQYTGEKVSHKDGNVDHVLPRSRGGRDHWENLVWSRKDINSKKGNRLNHEVGISLTKKPKAPPSVPASVLLGAPKLPEHRHFLIK